MLVPPAGSVPRATSVGTAGSPAGWHSGALPQLCPAAPSSPRCLWAGSCCHLLATLCPAERRWGQWPWDAAWGGGCRDNGSSPATEWGQDEGTAQSRPSPPSPQFSQGIRWHPQLYPPVMVAASRCVALPDRWDSGLVSGQAVTGGSGLGWQTGGLWRGRVSSGTGVSSLAGVTWEPGCHGKRNRLPWLPGAALVGGRVASPAPARWKGDVQVML